MNTASVRRSRRSRRAACSGGVDACGADGGVADGGVAGRGVAVGATGAGAVVPGAMICMKHAPCRSRSGPAFVLGGAAWAAETHAYPYQKAIQRVVAPPNAHPRLNPGIDHRGHSLG